MMNDPIPSHVPGSMEPLEDGDERLTPIDALLYWINEDQFEICYFRYKGIIYTILCEAWDGGEDYYFHVNDSDEWTPFAGILEILDSPILPDGATPRQALSSISFDDFQNI